MLSLTLAFLLPILITMAFGWFNGLLVTRYAIQPIVATLVLFIAGRGIAQVITNGNLQVSRTLASVDRHGPCGRHSGTGGADDAGGGRACLGADRYTMFGSRSSPSAANERAARLAGIPVRRVKCLVYIISGGLAGLAGLVVVARNSASDANLVGLGMELGCDRRCGRRRIAADGGRQHRRHAHRRALVIQLVRYTLLANGVPDAAALVVKAGLIILAVYVPTARRPYLDRAGRTPLRRSWSHSFVFRMIRRRGDPASSGQLRSPR